MGLASRASLIANATSLDVIEMDAASNNSVDDIRDLREKVAFAPVSGRHKVYILDEAHMLSPQAWNAFLKTLEEPPSRTIFVLATTEAQKVLPTVVDRCHRFDFGRPSVEQVAAVLVRVAEQEGIDIDQTAVALIARHATGSFRDALGTLEQLVTYAGGQRIEPADVGAVLGVADPEQLFDAVEAIVARDPAQGLRAAAALAESGRDPGQVLRDLEVHARELLTVQVLGEVPPELRVTLERDDRLEEQARVLGEVDTVRLLDLVAAALEATTNGAQARIQLELVLIKAAAPELDPSTTALLARIDRLESALRSGASVRPLESATSPGAGRRPGCRRCWRPRVRCAQPFADEADDRRRRIGAERPAPGTAAPAPARKRAATVARERAAPAAARGQSAPAITADEAPAPELGLQAAADCWPAVVEHVRQANAMLAALLADARPLAVSPRELTLAFPAGAAFLKRKAEQDDHRRMATEALREVSWGHASHCGSS